MAHTGTVKTALGDKLLFKSLVAEEQLGRLFCYDVKLLSTDPAIDVRSLLGKPVAVTFEPYPGFRRFFHGIASEGRQAGFERIQDVRYAQYELRVVPSVWRLTQRADCRIFKKKTVPEIAKAVMAEIGYTDIELSLTGVYAKREYCVQYRESDFDFISRLFEKEGIYYYFKHTAAKHSMVLADGLGAHTPARGFAVLPFREFAASAAHNEPLISAFATAQAALTTRYGLTDYDPMKPKTALLGTGDALGGTFAGAASLEVFDYPGAHEVATVGKHYAQVRLDALNVQRSRCYGSSNACGLAVGGLFKLSDFPRKDANCEYLVTGTRLQINNAAYHSGDEDGALFTADFDAIESRLPFRTHASTPQPRIAGTQTAIVAGKIPEAIEVDQYGRIQVIFHWSPITKKNHDISCPARVASAWAGKKWGAIHTPRVGQEVVVSFIEGDPDRPLVIGSVYNADNMPPYALPAAKTQSGVKSRSHLGKVADFNEIRFEDKLGMEELFVHAQKNMREEVEFDRDQEVGNNDTTNVVKKFLLKAGTEIELVTGLSSIVMKSTGEIIIKGMSIDILATQDVNIDAKMAVKAKAGMTMDLGAGISMKVHSNATVEVNGAASTTVKGAVLTLDGSGLAQLSGGVIMIG